MSATSFGLYELLAPQFLCGLRFPAHVDRYLSVARVERLRTAIGETAIVYSGEIVFGLADGKVQTEHREPSGGVLRWEDETIPFRLTVPRDGASFIDSAVTAIALADDKLQVLFNLFGAVELANVVGTDYPGVRFRLELLVPTLTFHLGDDWRGGRVDAATHRVVPDTSLIGEDAKVKFVLPKIALVYEQGDDPTVAPAFKMESWGSGGLDAPADLLMGELIRMEPPIALHANGRVAFGLDQVLLDLSQDNTPPELLAKFGVDESFEGLYLKSIRVYYVAESHSWGFQIAVQDFLIDFHGAPSFEASLDIFGGDAPPSLKTRFFNGVNEIIGVQAATPPQQVSLPTTGEIHVEMSGGTPPFTTHVTVDGTEIWDAASRRAPMTTIAVGSHTLRVVVTQASGPAIPAQEFALDVVAAAAAARPRDGHPADHPAEPMRPVTYSPELSTAPAGFSVTETGGSGTAVTYRVNPADATVTANGTSVPVDGGTFSIDVAEGGNVSVVVSWPGLPGRDQTRSLHFHVADPADAAAVTQYVASASGGSRSVSDSAFLADNPTGLKADLLAAVPVTGGAHHVRIEGFCSRSGNTAQYEQALSQRRINVAAGILGSDFTVDNPVAHGDTLATGDRVAIDQRVDIIYTVGARAAQSFTFTVSRAARPQPTPEQPDQTPADPGRAPGPEPNAPPPVFRRISFRTRFERGDFVLGEITGALDFETELEHNLRQGINDQGSPPAGLDDAHLDGHSQPTAGAGAGAGADDGVIEFGLTVTWDPATFTATESLRLHSGLNDSDGLYHIDGHSTPPSTTSSGSTDATLRLKDTFGAVAIFTPVINELASAIHPDDAGSWVAAGVSLVLPAAMGAIGLIQLKRFVLYGGELRAREVIAPDDPLVFSDVALMFDYGVEFFINIRITDSFKIVSTRPLRVRYKAVGFDLQFNPVAYNPVFDTSQGYEIDLRDPGVFKFPDPLGKIIGILGARIARVNPVMLEAELGLKANLGIITVDRFYLRWQVEPLGFPLIVPTGVKVDIPGALKGAGFVRILEDGFEGGIDLTIVPVKLRVAADIGVRNVKEGSKEATAFFLGMSVEFPTPILLGATGFGIYGFVGLFAAHYKRTEKTRAEVPPGIPPALEWLSRAKGEPQRLQVDGAPLWEPKIDRWAFGVGLIGGTAEGGFLVNFRGALVLELPGPRVLILVKVQIISQLPSMGESNLTVGILGVIDISPDSLTVGVLIDLNIVDLIKLKIPIEIFFNFHDKDDYHLWIGTIQAPASADILGIVKAHGYFMIDGKHIEHFPSPQGERRLAGLAVATGFDASLLFGDEGIGLYLKIAAGCDIGISFNPWYIAGRAYLTGELRIFIVSIGARGDIALEMGDGTPLYAYCKVCGKVDFFFFSVEGCVEFSINNRPPGPTPPTLATGMWLQSHAPVLTTGQGGDRPIDGTLGNALVLDAAGSIRFDQAELHGTSTSVGPGLLVDSARGEEGGRFVGFYLVDQAGAFHRITAHDNVDTTNKTGARLTMSTSATPASGVYALVQAMPVDSLPVLQLYASPRLDGGFSTFTTPLVTAPGLSGDGFTPIGGDYSARYTFTKLRLLVGGVDQTFTPERPPATWRRPHAPGEGNQDTALDLAMMTRVPITGERALEQSSELDAVIHLRRDGACTPVAPPTCVLWTFCRQRIGPSGEGWDLTGHAWPDPQGTRRDQPPDVDLIVEEPDLSDAAELFCAIYGPAGLPHLVPAQVLGRVVKVARGAARAGAAAEALSIGAAPLPKIDPRCIRLLELPYVEDGSSAKGGNVAQLDPDARRHAAEAFVEVESSQWVTLDTGEPCSARLYLAAPAAWIKEGRVVIDELRGKGLIRTTPVRELVTATVTGLNTGLPAEWLQDPWKHEVGTVSSYLATSEFSSLLRVIVTLEKPRKETDRLRIRVLPDARIEKLLERMKELAELAERDQKARLASEAKMAEAMKLASTSSAAVTPAPAVPPAAVLRPEATLVRPVATSATPAAATVDLATFKDRVAHLEELASGERIKSFVSADRPKAPQLERVILAVAQVCRRGEVQRAQTAQAVAQGEIDTLTGYLESDADVPLLRPATTYTVELTYTAETKDPAGAVTALPSPVVQSFRFRTDDAPPRRLDAYVLTTTPEMADGFHFYGDPIRVKFNDTAVLQLFGAYGRSLQMVLRAADGAPAAQSTVTDLAEMPGDLAAPYRALLTQLVASGALPCVGEVDLPVHGVWTAPPDLLRPLMDYVLDLQDGEPPADAPGTPLFRRRFRTSKFKDLGELAKAVSAGPLRHRALDGAIGSLPGVAGGSVAIAEDTAFEAALRAAGETELGASGKPQVTMYWLSSGGSFKPHALLVDAPEPLWRSRSKPELQTVPNQPAPADPAFKMIVLGSEIALEVTESGSSIVAGYVRNTAGTRTLVRLLPGYTPPSSGGTLGLKLRRPVSTQLALAAASAALLTLNLGPKAPWED